MHLNSLLLMSGTAVKGLQLFAALSILIVLHEFGHYFFARIFKTRVEKFYLFFDFLFPFSGLLNFSLFKKQVGDTLYGIGWFPLGGYVKISGMIDESMDKEALAKPPEPYEYRSKKPYQRLFIMLGGIIVNVVLAIFLYIVIFCAYGEEYLPTSNAVYGIAVDSVGKSIGLRNGDMIQSIDNLPVDRFDHIPKRIFYSHNQTGTIQVIRDGQKVTVNIPKGTVGKMTKMKKGGFISFNLPPVADTILPNSLASKSNMQKGDSIIAFNGTPIRLQSDLKELIKANYGTPVTISFVRKNTIDSFKVTIPKDSILGFMPIAENHLKIAKIRYGLMLGIGRGFTYTYETFIDYVTQFGLIFTSPEIKVNDSVGGFYSFGQLFPSIFDLELFLKLVAFISIILAFMNLLPIPGLDGGYVFFLLFEILSGRQVSEKVMERATTVGLVVLLSLMVYFNGLDALRYFKH
jgi:regulator of sigma E protease